MVEAERSDSSLLNDEEWGEVVAYLDPKSAMALGCTSVGTLFAVGTALLHHSRSQEHVNHTVRQKVVDMLARRLRRGLAAGQEAQVAAAVVAQAAAGVDVRIRRVAAKQIGYVLNIREPPIRCLRPGGWASVCASAASGAHNAMLACVGDEHAVATRIAAEPDALVRKYMDSWLAGF